MTQKEPAFVINVSNLTHFSGRGSLIVLELSNEGSALKLAQKIAEETGRRVTIRRADRRQIGTIALPAEH